MKGRRCFTPAEALRIQTILLERPRTKATRGKLRAIGFYISDFGASRFTVEDFAKLVETGEIAVSDQHDRRETASATTPVERSLTEESDRSNEEERQKYRPKNIKCLFVGESAPAGGTFFYFADSLLYRQTLTAFREVFGDKCGDGVAFLRFFMGQGFYLDDLCAIPVNHIKDKNERVRQRDLGVMPLGNRIKTYNPDKVAVVMKAIEPHVRQACIMAEVSQPCLVLPFPRPEHQRTFNQMLVRFLQSLA